MAGSTPVFPSVDASKRRSATSPWAEAWRRFKRHKMALASLFILGFMMAAVALGPLVWKVAINDIDFTAQLARPSLAHPMGTDDLGQDILARMIYGGRISLAVGFAAMAVGLFVGNIIGSIAGASKGPLDAALMWPCRAAARPAAQR